MCGVLAADGESTPENLQVIRKIIEECQIRGKHATGVSYIKEGTLVSIVEPIPSKQFLAKHWDNIASDLTKESHIKLIAHTRYSTSGIEFNQPIFDDELSVALNGVITQAHPSKWNSLYGVECKTTNDAEIVHIKIKQGVNPLSISGGFRSSMAIVALNKAGEISVWRNGRRPLWEAQHGNIRLVTSTKDIFSRAGINDPVTLGVSAQTEEEWQ